MATEINHSSDPNSRPRNRVLFVITQSEFGGAQHFVYNFLSRLEPDRYEVLVAIGSDGNGEFTYELKKLGIPVHHLKLLKRDINPGQDIKAVFEIRNLIKKFVPQTLFLNSSKAGFIGSLATVFPKRIVGLKVVYRIGGWSFNDPWPSWKRNFWKILEKKSAKWKDIIVVNNKHDLDQAEKLNIRPRGKVVLIHNGIDVYRTDHLPQEEARLRLFEKISRYSGKIFQIKNIIGTIANFYPTKGLEYLILAAKEFKARDDTAFFIIGDGEERPKLEKLIKENGLGKKVFLLGSIPEAKKLLQAFDIFVLPSVKEGFPWALIEAMAAKIPVIATSVGAVPEIIDNGKNGFMVAPRDPKALSSRIKEVLASDHLKKEFAIQGNQTVLFKFSEDKMVKEIEGLI